MSAEQNHPGTPEADGKRRWFAIGAWTLAAIIVLIVAAFLLDLAPIDIDRDRVARWIEAAGFWGPLAIIALMIVAVVASPIPSAPIALASGAAYGHIAGTLYVAIGAELGAIIAFLVARGVGRGAVEKWFGDKADYGLLGSQNALTLTVFVSRLLPFISFDAMSYAAGLSCLHFWRFALATLAGILPASFLLAHFGTVAMQEDVGVGTWIGLGLGLGLATALPLLWFALKHKGSQPNDPPKNGNPPVDLPEGGSRILHSGKE